MICLPLVLASCGGGGDPTARAAARWWCSPPVLQPAPQRGTPIGGATLVPAALASGAPASTLEPGEMKLLVDASVVLGTNVTSTPVCAVTTYTIKYHTVDALAAATDAEYRRDGLIRQGPACQGARPVLLYAHGTTVKKSADMADLSASEPLLIAALFAAQGYIVVAPNYAGYAGLVAGLSRLPRRRPAIERHGRRPARRARKLRRHEDQRVERVDVDRLFAGRLCGAGRTSARCRPVTRASSPVTAAAPLSGPYALLLTGDTIFRGAPTVGATGFLPLVIKFRPARGRGARAPRTGDIYEARYAPGIDTLLPGARGFGDLVAAGKLPDDVLFAQDSLPQAEGYASFFGVPTI